MNCPEHVSQAILEIIETACLSIRVAGWHNDARYCAIEANHIHNLPGLLLRFNVAGLDYYLEATREDYIEQLKEMESYEPPLGYEEQWRVLELYRRQT